MRKNILILITGLLILSNTEIYAQDTIPKNDSTQYEAYYCFAYFEDSMFYAPVFTIKPNNSFRKEAIETSWKKYVRNGLRLDWFLPVVEGPYGDTLNAKSDLFNFISQMPDSVLIYELPPMIITDKTFKYKDNNDPKIKKVKRK